MKLPDIKPTNFPLEQSRPFSRVAKPAIEKENRALWKAAQNFEALFMGQLLKTMRGSLSEDGVLRKGLPDLMFDQVMGSALSEGGGFGLAEMLYRDLQSKVIEDSSEIGNVASLQNLTMSQDREENDVESSSR